MKIYSVDVYNGESYEDWHEMSFGYFDSIEKASGYMDYILTHKKEVYFALGEEGIFDYSLSKSDDWEVTIREHEINQPLV